MENKKFEITPEMIKELPEFIKAAQNAARYINTAQKDFGLLDDGTLADLMGSLSYMGCAEKLED